MVVILNRKQVDQVEQCQSENTAHTRGMSREFRLHHLKRSTSELSPPCAPSHTLAHTK